MKNKKKRIIWESITVFSLLMLTLGTISSPKDILIACSGQKAEVDTERNAIIELKIAFEETKNFYQKSKREKIENFIKIYEERFSDFEDVVITNGTLKIAIATIYFSAFIIVVFLFFEEKKSRLKAAEIVVKSKFRSKS